METTDIIWRCQYDFVIGEQVRVSRTNAASLRPCNGMPGNNTGQELPEHRFNIFYKARLGTAYVGQNCVCSKMRAYFLQHLTGRLYRHCQHNKIRALNGLCDCFRNGVNHTQGLAQ